MGPGAEATPSLVLVTGHEGADEPGLPTLVDSLPGAVVTAPGWPLHRQVSALVSAGRGPVAVVPMTWGRDPVMVADTAKTLRWLSSGPAAGQVMLCAGFATTDHLVAHLRRAVRESADRRPGAGALITARASNPFDDAELYRVAHLVRTHGAGPEVEVACVRDADEVAQAVRRCRRLGPEEVVVVPAGFARTCRWSEDLDRVSFHGPLMSTPAAVQIVGQRVAAAQDRLRHGHDGIQDGLLADHGHGYAHSHGIEGDADPAGHTHEHAHPHAHPHPHPPGTGPDERRPHLVESRPGPSSARTPTAPTPSTPNPWR